MAHEFPELLEVPYRVAIPTYNRPKILREKTLALVENSNLELDALDIFVENEEQLEMYIKELVDDFPHLNYIVTHTTGICEKRNFVRYYYSMIRHNPWVFNMDDDLDYIMDKDNVPFFDFHNFIMSGFTECERVGATLFGISPLVNNFFLRDKVTYNLNYIIGAFFGVILEDGVIPFMTDMEHYEDFDFSLAHYFKDKKIVRYNHLGLKTKYFEDSGGITFQMGGRAARQKYMDENAEYMVEKWGNDAVKVTSNKWGTGLRLNHCHRFAPQEK